MLKKIFNNTRSMLYMVAAIMLFANLCCKPKPPADTLFTTLDASYTNISFSNDLSYDAKFNIYTYRNFYNGGGVAIGDINNDGLPDLFFTGNMVESKLYLNKGNFKFEDITKQAGITKKAKWSTGVSMADVNGDGLLDVYVCNSGDVKGDNKQNELFINKGNLHFEEEAAAYGLDDRGFSTHAAFFDFDHDGDLDMYLLNNSFKAIGSFNLRENERNKRDSLGGDKLFRNDNNHFTDISEAAGIYGSNIGFGLGVTVGDADNDGWQDIYVSNDFFERDYLYINQHNGTFKEDLENQMMSISNASMGADMADINNDANPDIFVTEMLPEKDADIKTKTTYQSWDKYQLDLHYDYYHQFTRNMLQLNNGNNTFSEIGRMANVFATDWSWGALMTDLDNDGLKDVFIANGIYQDLTNEDYVQYISNNEFYNKVVSGKADYKSMIDLIPITPQSNYAFSNNGNLTFTNKATDWGLSQPGFSNGSAYGDLDNDGDLDLVVNNVNMPCFVYRNESVQKHPEQKFLKVSLQGIEKNTAAIGAKVTVHYNGTLAYQEQMPMRGFESTVDNRLNFGLGKADKIDSVIVVWNNGTQTILKDVKPNQQLVVKQQTGSRLPVAINDTSVSQLIHPIFTTANSSFTIHHSPLPIHNSPFTNHNFGLDFIHKENPFADFDRDRLIFQMLSTQGPRMAKGDVNGDGLEDLYVCGAKDQPGALYTQNATGRFTRSMQYAIQADSASEDTDALFFDADNDGDNDLYVCSGGNEFSPNSTDLIDRLYINDGKGKFARSPQVLPSYIFESTSCVKAADYDADGDLDLFVGVRLTPFSYGYPCKGYLLNNNGKGQFKEVTNSIAPALKKAGMVTDAAWFDYDKDGRPDLVIAGEYMPVRIFKNEKNGFKEITESAGLEKSNGWWNRLQIADVNKDGYPDIIAANHGLNSRFKASETKPVSMYSGDFANNGTVTQIVTCYNGDSAYPMLLRHDLVSVLPYLKKKYLRYENYKEQTVEDIFSKEQLNKAVRLDAYNMQSTVFINDKKGGFVAKPLPMQAQISCMYAIATDDFDKDGNIDILMGGNFYQSKPEVGIYDASYGVLLKGYGNGHFTALTPQQSGVSIKGAVRDMLQIAVGKRKLLVVAKNNEGLSVLE